MELYQMDTIRPLLEKHGFRFSKSMGQNFLIQKWVPERIVAAAELDKTCGVFEIGPGIGVLTRELCRSAATVVAVELDKALLPVLEETLADCGNVTVINQNILKTKLTSIIDTYFNGLSPVVCANLPYNITSPVLTALLEAGCFQRITVMVQREVAQRICAKPGTPEYGAFTVFTNYYTTPRICFDVPPDCFLPRPKVTSTVLRLDMAAPPEGLIDKSLFFGVVRAAFNQRRKTLVNALTPYFSGRLTKDDIAGVLTGCGFDTRIRGETLDIPAYTRLSNAFFGLL